MRLQIFSISILAALLLPQFVAAESIINRIQSFGKEGILNQVGCKGVVDAGGKLTRGCGLCELLKLAKLIIDLLTTFAFGAAMLLFMYAGYLILLAGVTEHNLTEGKSIILGTTIGLIIVLVSWLAINFIFSSFVKDKYHWNKIDCSTTPPSVATALAGKKSPGTLQLGPFTIKVSPKFIEDHLKDPGVIGNLIIDEALKQFHDLSPEQKQQAIDALKNLTDEQRKQAFEYFNQLSPNQKNIIYNKLSNEERDLLRPILELH